MNAQSSFTPYILHHGGSDQVTGSCHELFFQRGESLLIDCGLFQGHEVHSPEIDFPVDAIRALIITHVHLDHVGRIPYLLAAGFEGPIYCSPASAVLLPLVLEDALKVGVTHNERLISEALKRVEKQTVVLDTGAWLDLAPRFAASVAIRFQPAGHILGSVYVQIRFTFDSVSHDIVFSGDLGAPYAPLLTAPKPPYRADTLILESTYGDRCHEQRRLRRHHLKAIIERSLQNRGVILIPAFSIGRTQELLYELESLIHRYKDTAVADDLCWADLEVVVDSPLASRFTDLYRQLADCWDREGHARLRQGRRPLSFEQITTIQSHQDHVQTVRYLKDRARPCIVIAASGMCSGGRIVDYLKALLSDARTDVVFVGYQAEGTPGRAIQDYGPQGGYVRLDGHKYAIHAAVHTLSGYSAHGGQDDLVRFVTRMRHDPRQIVLVHGETHARAALKDELAHACPQSVIQLPTGRTTVLSDKC